MTPESSIRVLYAAYRHDPRDPDRASGADYHFFNALKKQGFDVQISGPVLGLAAAPERLLRRIYRHLSGRDYTKFPVSLLWRSSRQLDRAIRAFRPDVLFSLFPPPLALYRGEIPSIYRLDTSFLGWQSQYPEFGWLGLKLSVWQERRVLERACRILTHSAWTRDVLLEDYRVPPGKIVVWPNPSGLPRDVVPPELSPATWHPKEPLRLLFVGRNADRKGLDIAVEIARRLQREKLAVELTVCGVDGQDEAGLRFVGFFRKSNLEQMRAYADLYRQAHLLLHPARFDPSPIVVSEAAALATPALTNACGGLETSVLNGKTGIVLPQGSGPDAYVEAIRALIDEPGRLTVLGAAARKRYELELNWDALGSRLGALVREVVRR